MIGLSLAPWIISDIGTDKLKQIKDAGVESIEIRNVFAGQDAGEALKIADIVWKSGMNISIHSDLHTHGACLDEVVYPIERIIENLQQPALNITVHSIKNHECSEAPTVGAVRDIALALKNKPVTVALENNRHKNDDDPCDTVAGVEKSIKMLNLCNVKACWDMGHDYYNNLTFTDNPQAMPSKYFLMNTAHTHIHSVCNGSTHFPLCVEHPMLHSYLKALKESDYKGIYNLEICFDRFEGIYTFDEAVFSSIKVLSKELELLG